MKRSITYSVFLLVLISLQAVHSARQEPASDLSFALGDPADTSDIFDAVKKKNTQAVLYWLSQGIDVNAVNKEGKSPLVVAFEKSSYDDYDAMILFLLQNGANPQVKTSSEEFLLIEALLRQDLDLTAMLLEYRADVDSVESTGRSAVDIAGSIGSAFFTLFVDRGAHLEPDLVESMITYAFQGNPDHVDNVRTLIRNRVAVLTDILMEKIAVKFYPMVRLLISLGVNPYTRDSSGATAFDYAQYDPAMLAILNSTRAQQPVAPYADPELKEQSQDNAREVQMRNQDNDIKKMIRRLEHIDRAMNPDEYRDQQKERKESAAHVLPPVLAEGGETMTGVHLKKYGAAIEKKYGYNPMEDPLAQAYVRAEKNANMRGSYVFCRAEPGAFRRYQYFIEELYRLVHLFGKDASFIWNRFFGDAAPEQTINEYVDLVKKDPSRATAYKRSSAFNRLLSANSALFGNQSLGSSCTWDYFLHNKAQETIDLESLFDRLFTIYGFDKKYIPSLLTADGEWLDEYASLQQIMIPRTIVDKVAMLADVGYCVPWPKIVDKECWDPNAVNITIQQVLTLGRHTCLAPILDKIIHGKIDINDRFQIRILMDSVYGLNPLSGIEIHQYTRLPVQRLQQLKRKIQDIAGDVFRTWLEKELKNKSVPRSVRDTKLGRTIKHVGKGRAQESLPVPEDEEKEAAVYTGVQRHQPASIWNQYVTSPVVDPQAIVESFIRDCDRDSGQNAYIPFKRPGIVRVMTYNVHKWQGPQGKPNFKEIVDVIESLDADVVVLQEVRTFRIETLDQIHKKFSALGYRERATEMIHGIGQHPEDMLLNMVLSKYPFFLRDNVVYKENSPGERRNFIQAIIELPDKMKTKLAIYGTHLDIQDASEAIREKQVAQLLDDISGEKDMNVILAGDWNAVRQADYQYRVQGRLAWDLLTENFIQRQWAFSGLQAVPTGALAMIEKDGFKDCFTKAGLQGPTYTVWSGTVVDFMFCGPRWNLPIAGCYVYYTCASDHLPVIMDIVVE